MRLPMLYVQDSNDPRYEPLGRVKADVSFLRPGDYDAEGNFTCVDLHQGIDASIIRREWDGELTLLIQRRDEKTPIGASIKANVDLPAEIWDEIVARAVVEEL